MRSRHRSIIIPLAMVFLWSWLFGFVGVPSVSAQRQGAAKPNAAVVGFRAGFVEGEEGIRAAVAAELEASNRIALIPEPVVGKNIADLSEREEERAVAHIKAGSEALARGRALYESLQLDSAIEAFAMALRETWAGMRALRDPRQLLNAYLYLGMALLVNGQTPEGKRVLREMIVLNPHRANFRLDPKQYSPKIVSTFDDLRGDVLSGPKGTVVLIPEPKDAIVYFDGVKQTTRLRPVEGVPEGDHFVLFEKQGFGRVAERVAVKAGENRIERVLDKWEPTAPFAFGRRTDQVANDLLVDVGRNLGAQILVLARAEKRSGAAVALTGQLYDVRSREFTAIERVDVTSGSPADSARELARRMLSHLTVSGMVMPQITPMEGGAFGVAPAPTGWTSQWWFWAAVLGVVAAGVGGYYALRPSEPNYNLVVFTPP